MLSKLIAYAPTRDLAIARLRRALDEYVIGGIRTNLGLFRRILDDPDFRPGRIDTGYLDRLLAEKSSPLTNPLAQEFQVSTDQVAAIAAGVFHKLGVSASNGADASKTTTSAWKQLGRREGLRS